MDNGSDSDTSGFGMEDSDDDDAEREEEEEEGSLDGAESSVAGADGSEVAESVTGAVEQGHEGSDAGTVESSVAGAVEQMHEGSDAGTVESNETEAEEEEGEQSNGSHASKNCNSQGKSLVQVCIQDFMQLKESDGMPFFFVSESMGPAVSPMAMQQVLGLLHLFNHPLEPEHIVSTGKFEVVWDKSKAAGKRGTIMEKLRMTVNDWSDPDSHDTEGFSTIDDYPTKFHGNFTDQKNGTTKKVVPFAEILLSPVVAHYTDNSTGRPCCKTFWVVIVKTRRVYNFTKHLCDFLRSPDKGLRDYQRGKDWQEIYQLWQEILLHQYGMSPSATAYIDGHLTTKVSPIERLDEHGQPDSLCNICNVFEIYRGIIKCLGAGAKLGH